MFCSGVGGVAGAGFSCMERRAREAGGGATVVAQMGFALVVCQLSLGADDSEDKLFAHGSLSPPLLHELAVAYTLEKPKPKCFFLSASSVKFQMTVNCHPIN